MDAQQTRTTKPQKRQKTGRQTMYVRGAYNAAAAVQWWYATTTLAKVTTANIPTIIPTTPFDKPVEDEADDAAQTGQPAG